MDDKTRTSVARSLHAAADRLDPDGAVSASRDRYDLKFIKKYIDKLADYELADLERKLKGAEIRERTGLSIDKRTGRFAGTTIKVDLLDPLDKILKQIEKSISKDYDDVDFEAYKAYLSVIKEYFLRHTKGNSYTIALSRYPLRALVAFLQWIISGKVESDFSKASKLMEEVGLSSQDTGTFELPGVKLKVFKNGRVDVKFKDSGDAKKMQETVEQWDKKWEADRRAGANRSY